jgi:hypothetical protein
MVLLDRNLQQPLNTADTITMDEATKGMVAVYTKDINRLLHTIQSLTKFIDDKKIDEEKVIDLQVGNSKCIVKTEKNGAVNSYNIVLTTDTGNFKTAFVLVSHETSKRAVQRLTMFLYYLRNNISVMPGLEKL